MLTVVYVKVCPVTLIKEAFYLESAIELDQFKKARVVIFVSTKTRQLPCALAGHVSLTK